MSDKMRQAFEAWISAPPFERPVKRLPMDEAVTSWPGAYRPYEVELAWEAWQAALAQAEPRGEGVAWGLPNTAITGKKMALMMVRLDIPSDDEYGGAMWVPLYAAPPAPVVQYDELAKLKLLASTGTVDSIMSRPELIRQFVALGIQESSRRARAEGCLGEAIDVLRSVYAVAARGGADTNWPALTSSIEAMLAAAPDVAAKGVKP